MAQAMQKRCFMYSFGIGKFAPYTGDASATSRAEAASNMRRTTKRPTALSFGVRRPQLKQWTGLTRPRLCGGFERPWLRRLVVIILLFLFL
ncbi:hypothetical protein ABL78_1744 [Leptomonas seymouri]|uniref:Uncharacterized protein n=1 Tax=Leptomonas seymouri TaxID=5684 RepID=A0A0N1IM70_LEPSE|nr:hypothetical protein ABL78_1744 [Leptomonas seymouri]|eukprot:KPI89100.1 hypothetical protein ABL78_1744 [Leptomonas seymouri]